MNGGKKKNLFLSHLCSLLIIIYFIPFSFSLDVLVNPHFPFCGLQSLRSSWTLFSLGSQRMPTRDRIAG